jgi:hypothetical protein
MMSSSTSSLLRSSFVAIVVAAIVGGCAAPQKPAPRPRAQPRGLALYVAEPTVTTTTGTACATTVTEGIGPRFRSAATTALTEAGFRVADAADGAAFVAHVALDVDYCSDAGIVSGTTALTLKQKGTTSVWRGQATGDQARGETATSTVRELVEKMLFDPQVIDATEAARR